MHGFFILLGRAWASPPLSVVDVYVGASCVRGVWTIKYDWQAIQVVYMKARPHDAQASVQ